MPPALLGPDSVFAPVPDSMAIEAQRSRDLARMWALSLCLSSALLIRAMWGLPILRFCQHWEEEMPLPFLPSSPTPL